MGCMAPSSPGMGWGTFRNHREFSMSTKLSLFALLFCFSAHAELQVLEFDLTDPARKLAYSEMAVEKLYSGRPVLVDFWASWCSKCMGKLKALNELRALAGKKCDFVAINAGESDAELEK